MNFNNGEQIKQFEDETNLQYATNIPLFFSWKQTKALDNCIAEMKLNNQKVILLTEQIQNIANRIDWNADGSGESMFDGRGSDE